MSIVGTDGYTNSNTVTVSSTQSDAAYTLNVPGGAAGVHDVVTVTIALPGADLH